MSLEIPKRLSITDVTMDDVSGQSLLLLEDGHCLRNQALHFCKLSGALETAGFRATSLETLRQMVAAGSGITLIPEIAISKEKDKSISYISFVGDKPSRIIGLVWRKSNPHKKMIDRMSAILKACRQEKHSSKF